MVQKTPPPRSYTHRNRKPANRPTFFMPFLVLPQPASPFLAPPFLHPSRPSSPRRHSHLPPSVIPDIFNREVCANGTCSEGPSFSCIVLFPVPPLTSYGWIPRTHRSPAVEHRRRGMTEGGTTATPCSAPAPAATPAHPPKAASHNLVYTEPPAPRSLLNRTTRSTATRPQAAGGVNTPGASSARPTSRCARLTRASVRCG